MSGLVELEAAQVKAMLDKGEAVLVDVREPYEYGAERIQGALLFPLATFRPENLPTGGKIVILQCGTGKRSGMAAQKMLDAGAGTVHHLKGGIGAWKEAKLPLWGINPTTGAVEAR